MTEAAVQTMLAHDNPDEQMRALSIALRHVGAPLLTALLESAPQTSDGGRLVNFAAFPDLVDSTTQIARQIMAGSGGQASVPPLRWSAISAACQLVATNYKATAQAMDAEAAAPWLEIINALPEKFKHLVTTETETLPNQIAVFRAKALDALVPAVSAVAHFSFLRGEHGLLADVAERLMKTADQITRTLAPAGSTSEQWRILCWVVLKAAGQIYAECHDAEANRIYAMAADERTAYFAKHGNLPPMTHVWQDFQQRMGLLTTLGTYLEVPPAAKMDEEGWS